MNIRADKTSENKSQAVANTLPKQQSNGESTFQFIDNRPEAIVQRKFQEAINNSPRVQQLKSYQEKANNSLAKQAVQLQVMAVNNSPRQKPIQMMRDEELKTYGKVMNKMAEEAPTSGFNLWHGTASKTGGKIFILGTGHSLTLTEMIGLDPSNRSQLVRFLQQTPFTKVLTERPEQVPYLRPDPDIAKKLENLHTAMVQCPLPSPEDTRAYAIATKRSERQKAEVGGYDLRLDAGYLALATTGKNVSSSFLDKDGMGSTRSTRDEAGMINRMDAVKDLVDYNWKSGNEDQGKADLTEVLSGNQQQIFAEQGVELSKGMDKANAEERNKHWIRNELKDTGLLEGEIVLWIVGAAHIPGLIIGMKAMGINFEHEILETPSRPRDSDKGGAQKEEDFA